MQGGVKERLQIFAGVSFDLLEELALVIEGPGRWGMLVLVALRQAFPDIGPSPALFLEGIEDNKSSRDNCTSWGRERERERGKGREGGRRMEWEYECRQQKKLRQ